MSYISYISYMSYMGYMVRVAGGVGLLCNHVTKLDERHDLNQ
jgi:hypothetical protein